MTDPTALGRQRALIACGLFFLTAFVFSPALLNDFVLYDDGEYITGNSHVRAGLTLGGLRWALGDLQSGSWHPLTWLSHMADVEIFGLAPAGHHLVSVLLHALTAAALFLLLHDATGRAAPGALAAALFALHPLHVESVAWASERKDVLAALFWVLAAAAHVRYARRPSAARHAAVLALGALALTAKPMAVTLPLTLLLLDLWPLGRWRPASADSAAGLARARWRPLVEKLPLLALAAAAAAITVVAQRGAASGLDVVPLGVRAANVLSTYGRYLLKTVWPGGLAVFYPHQMYRYATAEVFVWALLLAGASLAAYRLRGTHPAAATGWLWYLATLLPVIGLVQVGAQGMADRYTYLPLVGIFVLIAWEAAALAGRSPALRRATTAAAALVLVACATLSVAQLRHWRDSVSLFDHAARVTRDNYLAFLNLGVAYAQASDLARAEQALLQAARIVPEWDEPHYQLGVLYASFGQRAHAEREYRTLLRLGSPAAAQLERFLAVLPR